MNGRIRLRPHHLICHRLHGGSGYDQTFVDNMRAIIARLETNMSARIDVAPECDDICAACPHKVEGLCDFGDSVRAKDESAAKFLHVPTRFHMTVRQMDALLKFRFKKLDNVAQVCGQCEWSEVCNRQLAIVKSKR